MSYSVEEILFNPRSYALRAGVSESEALADYLQGGWRLLNPHPLFDTEYFLNAYGAGAEFTDPLDLYKKVSAHEAVNTTPFIHLDWAIEKLGARLAAPDNFVLNYILSGAFAGWRVNPLYDLQLPADTDPKSFWSKISTLDDLISGYDSRRLVTAEWLEQTYGYPAGGAHEAFWRERPVKKQWWPFSPELLFGPIGVAGGVSIGEYAETFRKTLHKTPEWLAITERIKGGVQLLGYRGEVYDDGWIGRVSEFVLAVDEADGSLEFEFYVPDAMPPHRLAARVEADPAFSTDSSFILGPGDPTSTRFPVKGSGGKLRVRLRCDTHKGSEDARHLGAVLVGLRFEADRSDP